MAEKLDKLKRERTQLRRLFTKTANELETVLTDSPDDTLFIMEKLNILEDKVARLFPIDEQILQLYSASETSEAEYCLEVGTSENYRERMIHFRTKCEDICNPAPSPEVILNSTMGTQSGDCSNKKCRKLRLPKIELKSFNGDVWNWIGFWGQFRKIHEDPEIDLEDKFQYLLQATEPGSNARALAESFPPSAENYEKAVSYLKNRYARTEYLIEIYVRDLLGLVLSQNSKFKTPLSKLYDQLETQLRSLESLGLTSEKYAAILLPLAESALPEDILRAWERHRTSRETLVKEVENAPTSLQHLLGFLKNEVESEERIRLARGDFTKGKAIKKVYKKKVKESGDVATASAIFCAKKGEKQLFCIFCDKNSLACR